MSAEWTRDGGVDVAVASSFSEVPAVPRARPPVGSEFGEARYRAPIRFQDEQPAGLTPGQPQPRFSSDAIFAVPSTAATAALDVRLVRLYRRYAIIAAVITVAIGGSALLGWITGTLWLASLNPAWVTMAVNTAVCLVLAGIGLLLAIPDGSNRPATTAALEVLAGIVALTGLATVAEYAMGRDFGIDQSLIVLPPVGTGAVLAGRMAPLTAINFVLVGLVLLAHATKRNGLVSTTLNLVVLVSAVLSLTGYVLGSDEFYTLASDSVPIALPTAVGFLLVSSGFLVVDPEWGLLPRLASPRAGGVMLRRLLPVAVFLPVLIAWLQLQAQPISLFDHEFAAAAAAMANVLIACSVLFWAAKYLDRSDAARLHGEAHRAMAQYARSLIEASLDPLVMVGAEGRITDVNEAAVKVTGVPRDKLIGSDFSGYFTDPEKARKAYREAFSRGLVSDYPLAIRHVSGRLTDVLHNASVYRDENGQVAGVVAASRDISARKRAEDELRKFQEGLEQTVAERTSELSVANAGLEAANNEAEAFSYSVSHDLRTPLRAIDGFSRILLEDYTDRLDPEGQRVLNVVRDSTVRMSRLIDDILAFSRAGRVELQSAPVDMEGLVRQTLAGELASVIAERKLATDVGKVPSAQGDRAMLQRVWINLLDNAIKFTAPKPDARIEIGATADDGETVYCVRDNGVGFDMRYAAKLFGVFQRLHGAEFPGTGIGLAIVRRIVTRHGGRVWAEGKVGEGATFYFALPTPEASNVERN